MSSPFHLARDFCSCHSREQSRVPLCILCCLLLFPRVQLLLVLSQLFLLCSGNLTYTCSCVFLFSRLCCSRQHERVDACLCIYFASSSNLSRVGDRPYTSVHKSWSSVIACGQSKHAQIRHCHSRSWHAMIFATHCKLEFTSDVSTCTK